jgi:transcriptional regulator with XRE-family HTH domain
MPMATEGNIGQRVRDARKAAGLTQRQLAEAAGVDLSRLRQLEQGVVADPRVSILRAVAKALKVSWEDLFGPVEEIKPEE